MLYFENVSEIREKAARVHAFHTESLNYISICSEESSVERMGQ
jgi:hypothetical protein